MTAFSNVGYFKDNNTLLYIYFKNSPNFHQKYCYIKTAILCTFRRKEMKYIFLQCSHKKVLICIAFHCWMLTLHNLLRHTRITSIYFWTDKLFFCVCNIFIYFSWNEYNAHSLHFVYTQAIAVIACRQNEATKMVYFVLYTFSF